MRIAVVGNDSSHADKFVARWAGVHELIVAEATRHPREFDVDPELTSTITVVDTVDGLIGWADGAVVGHRRGSQHRAAAVPLLEAGIPVFVDKPLAGSRADAEAIVAAAEAGGAALASWSALRWSPLATMARALDPIRLLVEGPADPKSEYGGISFYGVHCADLAVALLGSSLSEVSVRVEDDLVITDLRIGDRSASLVLTPPDRAQGFRLVAESRTHAMDRTIVLKSDYMNQVADLAEEMFATGVALQTRNELLAVVRITDAMEAALADREGNPT